jgi:dihydrodipicolinate synthase/N-acetylneuraminate lyase
VKADELRGVLAIIPTPAKAGSDHWDATDTVDLAETARVVAQLVADGVDGLIVLGTTGEVATITRDEYRAFVDCVLSTIGGRIPTFVGTTSNGTHDVVDRTRFAAERGATGILLGPPSWQPMTCAMATEFYRTIYDAFPQLPVMVYGIGRVFRFDFSLEFWAQVVAAAPNVMSSLSSRLPSVPEAIAASRGRIAFLPDESRLVSFAEAAPEQIRACWSTACSMGPEPALALMRALAAGDLEQARAIDARISWAAAPLRAISDQPELFASYNIQMEKIRIQTAGYCNAGPIRPPYNVIPDEYRAAAAEAGERWKSIRGEFVSATRG